MSLGITAGVALSPNVFAQSSDAQDLDQLLGPAAASGEAQSTNPTTPAPASANAPQPATNPSEKVTDAGTVNLGSTPPSVSAPSTLGSLPVVPVQAANDSDAAGPKGNHRQIEEIVVSARRTEENMQDVPVTISAMSASDLQRESINSVQNLQGKVPSLVISTNSQMRSTETPSIRGQGAQFGAAPGVIIYFAETPLPSDLVANNQGGPGKFFDLQNLQVLKGSQGTLFGRNTTGGALLLEPTRPQDDFSASLRTDGSTLAGIGYEAVVNVPVIQDKLLARGGFKFYERRGFTRDVSSGKDYDSKHFWTGRLGLTWRPTEGVENYMVGYYTRNHDNGTGNVIDDINRTGMNRGILGAIGLGLIPAIPDPLGVGPGCVLLDLNSGSTNCGQDILDQQHARGVRQVQLSADPNDILDTGGLIDNFSYEIADDMTLRNIVSYSKFKHSYRWDMDGSKAQFIDYANKDDQFQADLHTITEELQLQGKELDGKLTYVVGGYYENTQAKGVSDAHALFVEEVLQNYTQKKTSLAPFAQTTFDLGGLSDSLSGLNLTSGMRYTFDKTTGFAELHQIAAGAFTTVDNPHTAASESKALTYTLGLDYRLGPNMVYGKISRGYKTGGISVISVSPDHYTYQPEYVLNYEIGQKADFQIGEVPVRLNTAVYYTDYSNLQKASVDTYSNPNQPSPLPEVGAATINAGKAKVYGLELEATVQPFEGTTFVATYAYTQAAYTQFHLKVGGVTGQVDCSGQEIAVGGISDLKCVPFQQTPRNSFSLSGRYLLPIDEHWGQVEGSLSYNWTARQYTSTDTVPSQEPGAWLSPVGLWNGSIRWGNVLGSAFDMQLYGTNLTNKLYRIGNSNQWTFTYVRSSIWSEPRIVGLQFGYHWN